MFISCPYYILPLSKSRRTLQTTTVLCHLLCKQSWSLRFPFLCLACFQCLRCIEHSRAVAVANIADAQLFALLGFCSCFTGVMIGIDDETTAPFTITVDRKPSISRVSWKKRFFSLSQSQNCFFLLCCLLMTRMVFTTDPMNECTGTFWMKHTAG